MTIRAVFFDVGGTLIDETQQWVGWANWLGVPAEIFFSVLGSVIERRGDVREVFGYFDHPEIDPIAVRAERMAAGEPDEFGIEYLYLDVVESLRRLNKRYLLGIAGNQPLHRQEALENMGLPVNVVATSAKWGVEKPQLAFFERISETVGLPSGEIAYVGDRLDNDVLPAIAAGMVGVFLRRGPWGYIHAKWPEVGGANVQVNDLFSLDQALLRWS